MVGDDRAVVGLPERVASLREAPVTLQDVGGHGPGCHGPDPALVFVGSGRSRGEPKLIDRVPLGYARGVGPGDVAVEPEVGSATVCAAVVKGSPWVWLFPELRWAGRCRMKKAARASKTISRAAAFIRLIEVMAFENKVLCWQNTKGYGNHQNTVLA